MDKWQAYLQEHTDEHMAELLDLLRIPSISALPENAPDVHRAGEWVADRLARAGVENVKLMETGGHPVVYGDWLHAGDDKPTIMFYGHFDTQPVDPIELWTSSPFDPLVDGDRIYARGSTDDKGNLFPTILAAEALLQTEGALPVNCKFFYEGQEEIGSPQLHHFLGLHKEMLACDMVFVADGGQFSEDEPALQMGLRGMCGLELLMVGPSRDLHSGTFGGAVQNPLHAMVRLLDSMRSPEGRILVEGFYDGVAELSDDERAEIARVPLDIEAYKEDLAVDALFSEPGYSPREGTWIRPTLEINGLWGGFIGEGGKTVLPSEAHVKITCRLVPNQDPAQVFEAIKAHIAKNTPPGVTVDIIGEAHGAPAYVVSDDHPGNQAARTVLTELYGAEPYRTRMGGSVPITSLFEHHLGVKSIVFSFGLPDERTHSPNEFFRISSFEKAKKAFCMLMKEMGR